MAEAGRLIRPGSPPPHFSEQTYGRRRPEDSKSRLDLNVARGLVDYRINRRHFPLN
jgi:hypothetical protein